MNDQLRFDRRVAAAVLDQEANGALAPMLEFVSRDRTTRDLQLRARPGDAERGRGAVSAYVGLTRVLNVDVDGGRLRLDAHDRYRSVTADVPWRVWVDGVDAVAIATHLERAAQVVEAQWVDGEGRVHAAMAAPAEPRYVTTNREVSLAFASQAHRTTVMAEIASDLHAACHSTLGAERWFATAAVKQLGTGLDFIGLDHRGRVLAIEAKATGATAGVVRGPLQTLAYALLIERWVRQDADHAADVLDGIARQRHTIGLLPRPTALRAPLTVVPVLAIGADRRSSIGRARAELVAKALAGVSTTLEPMEIWDLDVVGRIESVKVVGR